MYTLWTAHCKNEHDKANFEADLRRAKSVLDRQKTILEEMGKAVELESYDFSTPSWPYAQAAAVGAKKVITDLIKLIDLDKQKDKIND